MIVPDSLCNDTLSADTLCKPEPQDTLVEDLISFDDCGYFSGDSLLHTEVPYRPFGFGAAATPISFRNNAWSGVLLFVCLLLAACLVIRLRKKFGELLQSVFLPIPGKADEPPVDDPLRYSTRLIAVVLLSLVAAIITFVYIQHDTEFYLFSETPYLLFGAFFVLWLCYFLLKRLLSGFVNWVFFRQEKIFTWQRSYTFLYVMEAMLLLIFALMVMYLPIPHGKVPILAFSLVALVKIVLLFKTYKIFFPKIYGTLHLIVYFCTLELMPLLVMQQILTYAGYLWALKI